MRDIAPGVKLGFVKANGHTYIQWRDGPEYADSHSVRLPPDDEAAVRALLATPAASLTRPFSVSIHGGRATLTLSKVGDTVNVAWTGAKWDGKTKHETNETERILVASEGL